MKIEIDIPNLDNAIEALDDAISAVEDDRLVRLARLGNTHEGLLVEAYEDGCITEEAVDYTAEEIAAAYRVVRGRHARIEGKAFRATKVLKQVQNAMLAIEREV